MTNELRFESKELMETTQAVFDLSLQENPVGETCKEYFVGVFCEKTHQFRKNIVDNEMKLRYYET